MGPTRALFASKERTHLMPREEAEGYFEYLDRSARPESENVRNLLNEWFAHYPPKGSEALVSRIRSSDEREFSAAFTELYCHELLRCLGYDVELHPPVPAATTRPDFLARGRAQLYVEATIAMDKSDAEWGEEMRKRAVYASLNRHIDSPNFFVHLDVRGAPSHAPAGRKAAKTISRWLATLDPDEWAHSFPRHGFEGLPSCSIRLGDWDVRVVAIPKKPEKRGRAHVRPVGSKMGGVAIVNTVSALRNALCRKAARYGDLGKPYVVFVNVQAFHLDEDEIFDALFGGMVYRLPTKGCSWTAGRNRDGVWLGPSGARNGRVSGVLVTHSLEPWNIGTRAPALIRNPFADHPLVGQPIERLGGWGPVRDEMKQSAGESAAQTLGISECWPHSGVSVGS